MEIFNIPPSREIGILKEAIKEAILEGEIPNEYQAAYDYMMKKAEKMGLKKI
jgi:tRNA nucleotidyltransferase (CCA-adding enzyme)